MISSRVLRRGWGGINAAQTLQRAIKVGRHDAEIVLTHDMNIPTLVNVLKAVLAESNLDGQIKAFIPARRQANMRRFPTFDLRVASKVKDGYRLVGNSERSQQEVFAVTDYSAKELQFVIDVAMGKYNWKPQPTNLSKLTLRKAPAVMYPRAIPNQM